MDLATFATCFGLVAPTASCDADERLDIDLNDDQLVNLVDFATLAIHFGAWPPVGVEASGWVLEPTRGKARHGAHACRSTAPEFADRRHLFRRYVECFIFFPAFSR